MKLLANHKILPVYVLLLIIGLSLQGHRPQQQKKRRRVDIVQAGTMQSNENIVANAQRLLDSVILKHEGVIMYCDSAYSYTDTNMVEAFGNVHIIQNDTLHLYGRYLNYNGESKIAKVRRDVKLVNKSITVTTDSLDFDMNTNIGYYNYGGTIVDTANILTSIIGRYYSNEDMFFFKDSVTVVNNDFVMNSDTLKYFSNTEVVSIVGPTTIESNDGGILYSENGWYNTKTGIAELYKASRFEHNEQTLEGDTIFYNRDSGDGKARHQVKLTDLKNNTIITGKRAIYNEITERAMVTDSALFVQISEQDTLFMHADTLRSIPDTAHIEQEQKIFLAYNRVRFFRSDLQGKCDSLTYNMEDSVITMYDDPVLWSQNNQMTATVIEVLNKNPEPNFVKLNQNAFIIMEESKMKFNQIYGRNMLGYIRNNELYQVDVNGNGRSVYFAKDKETYVGINRVESSNIVIYLKESHIDNITFLEKPEATMMPMDFLDSEEAKIKGFIWRISERPVDKDDIYPRVPESQSKNTDSEKKAGL